MNKELIEKCNVLAQRVEKLEADRDALAGISKELIERLREAAAQRVASTAMIGADDLIAAASRASSGGNFGNPALESIRNQFIESLNRLKMAYNGHVTAPFSANSVSKEQGARSKLWKLSSSKWSTWRSPGTRITWR